MFLIDVVLAAGKNTHVLRCKGADCSDFSSHGSEDLQPQFISAIGSETLGAMLVLSAGALIYVGATRMAAAAVIVVSKSLDCS